MAKKVKTILKLNITAGKANPAPPIGPALGQHGVNIMEFCQQYNAKTKDMKGVVPAEVKIYEDRTFDFILKKPPVSQYIKSKLSIKNGSKEPGRVKAGTLSQKDLEEIALEKMADFNTKDLEAAKKIVAGSARSMGVEIK
ncbi:50S ribosomal protein L11 [Candidatus Beckwithbacteria bacterium CG10_big_fil_rev_8_21_14_0_10_34_10]|uniref:Large ribosomal subunit protein uL11 n=1 Tax=Candidatus Beckwithbacteria bacterium CG10_big_fil_rev_8_21_14_0_10_34_10 TaxID=1974495 RepID=A0A2H0W864_9BACT|nr:MAG: 50S ribosomal protein L11 [Candidatus Beckwithbacteria bacterium CG10_big_fil_rev_8_21_14_0_10_34_10]